MEIKREHCMEQIHIRENNGMVKVITGVRQFLLDQNSLDL